MKTALETLSKTDLIALIEERDSVIQKKEQELEKLRRMLFGQRRERFEASPIQLPLDFGQVLSEQDIQALEARVNQQAERVKQAENKTAERGAHPGRSPLPKHLPVKQIVLQPDQDTTDLVVIGEEVSESLQYEPSHYYIQRIIRPNYAPKASATPSPVQILIAPLPASAFGKCMAGSGVIAQVLVDKYCDHLPLYRQKQRFEREGIPVEPATLENWAKLGMQRLELLYDYQKSLILKSPYLQADETTIRVLDPGQKKGTTHQGYFWAYHDPLGQQTLFQYETGRGGKYPFQLLQNFEGYLQTDGYAGYNGLTQRQQVVHLACWAHARRKFEEALAYERDMASIALSLIGEMYAVERKAKLLQAPQQIKELRLQEALPTYNLLGKWISAHLAKVIPKSPIGQALHYAMNRWDELGHYMYDGRLQIDNNNVENAIRAIALGRKNYLFAGNHQAAQRAAVVYTFTDPCKRHGINPHHWLTQLFDTILDTKPSNYHSLLPQNFKNPE